MNRACKYGERLSNGKCPKKPTTRKLRACKYGERLSNGKCPKKPNKKKLKSFSLKSKTLSTSKSLTNSSIKMNNPYNTRVGFSDLVKGKTYLFKYYYLNNLISFIGTYDGTYKNIKKNNKLRFINSKPVIINDNQIIYINDKTDTEAFFDNDKNEYYTDEISLS
jgi:hypothetical protein